MKENDKLTSLKTILKEIEELDIIRQLEIKQKDKIKKELENFLERPNNIEEKIKFK